MGKNIPSDLDLKQSFCLFLNVGVVAMQQEIYLQNNKFSSIIEFYDSSKVILKNTLAKLRKFLEISKQKKIILFCFELVIYIRHFI